MTKLVQMLNATPLNILNMGLNMSDVIIAINLIEVQDFLAISLLSRNLPNLTNELQQVLESPLQNVGDCPIEFSLIIFLLLPHCPDLLGRTIKMLSSSVTWCAFFLGWSVGRKKTYSILFSITMCITFDKEQSAYNYSNISSFRSQSLRCNSTSLRCIVAYRNVLWCIMIDHDKSNHFYIGFTW